MCVFRLHSYLMSTTLFYSDPANNLLYRDPEIVVTMGRIEVEGTSYVTKYISSMQLLEAHPWRKQGWIGLCFCAIGALALLIYLYLGKIAISTYVVSYLILVILAITITLYLIMGSALYGLEISLINGQKRTIHRNKQAQINEIHSAMKQAIAYTRQDQAISVHSPTNLAEPIQTPPPSSS